MYDESKRKVFARRDEDFNENDFRMTQEVKISGQEIESTSPKDMKIKASGDQDKCSEEDQVDGARRAERVRRPPIRNGYDEYADNANTSPESCYHLAYSVEDIEQPSNFRDALDGAQAEEWKPAADFEYKSLMENNTWKLVELPSDRKAAGCKWVFKVKYGVDGTVERFKARLVAKGYAQKYGIDYNETFSPVVRFSSIRVLLAFAVQRGMLIHQMDVVTAFLNGRLKEEIYMDQPEGYVKTGQEHLVCKLEKSLYGLKQAPRCWNKAFREHLESNGFTQTSRDACVYVKCKETLIVIAVYVDDLIILAETAEEMAKIKETLSTKLKMKDMKELHYCLGITIVHDRVKQKVWLNQYQYNEKLLKKFGQAEAKTMLTPADINVKLKKNDNVSKHVDTVQYQSLVNWESTLCCNGNTPRYCQCSGSIVTILRKS